MNGYWAKEQNFPDNLYLKSLFNPHQDMFSF